MPNADSDAGRIVNHGTPRPHECSTIHAPGRPWKKNINPGAVWLCSCGAYYQMREIRVVDIEGDDAGSEERWFRVKNADGDDYRRVEIDPGEYLTPRILGAQCETHGRVRKAHRHHRWI